MTEAWAIMVQWKWKKMDRFKMPIRGSRGQDWKWGMWIWRTWVSKWMDRGTMYWDETQWGRGQFWVENSRFQLWMCWVQDAHVIIKRLWAWSLEAHSGVEIKETWTYRGYIKLWEWVRLSVDKVESQKREKAKTGPETTLIFKVRERWSQQGRLRYGQREERERGEAV